MTSPHFLSLECNYLSRPRPHGASRYGRSHPNKFLGSVDI